MSCRRAAAVAFIWFLLVPPLNDDDPPSSNPHAPLPGWEVESAHESAGECEEAREDFQAFYQEALMFYGVCVSDRDPRLRPHRQRPPAS
jgi:hypothetical protein